MHVAVATGILAFVLLGSVLDYEYANASNNVLAQLSWCFTLRNQSRTRCRRRGMSGNPDAN